VEEIHNKLKNWPAIEVREANTSLFNAWQRTKDTLAEIWNAKEVVVDVDAWAGDLDYYEKEEQNWQFESHNNAGAKPVFRFPTTLFVHGAWKHHQLESIVIFMGEPEWARSGVCA
jgi:hypothetical protein